MISDLTSTFPIHLSGSPCALNFSASGRSTISSFTRRLAANSAMVLFALRSCSAIFTVFGFSAGFSVVSVLPSPAISNILSCPSLRTYFRCSLLCPNLARLAFRMIWFFSSMIASFLRLSSASFSMVSCNLAICSRSMESCPSTMSSMIFGTISCSTLLTAFLLYIFDRQ